MQDPIQRHPTRAEQLDIVIDILAATVPAKGRVLDLGCGTGFLGHLLHAKRDDIGFVGVDMKPESLAEAAKNVPGATLIEGDLDAPGGLDVPAGSFDAIVTVLTFHDLNDDGKQRVLAWAADRLAPKGVLLVMDRLRLTAPALFEAQKAIWARLERVHGVGMRSASDFDSYVEDLGSENRPAPLQDYFAWLSEVGLAAACLHLHGNIAIIGAARA
ncbi:MAG: class I SAM-dependent methyltransferase [Alphaproteobacteria bacterium]